MASAPPSSEPEAETPPDSGPEAPTASAAPEPAPEPRFFRWIRGLGLVRRTGWLGGVCAAVAERTRLDPILVRGVVVVLAVLGAPVVLAYAAAWFLLPDEKGAIHALTLARGRVEGAVVAIAALTVASFLPLTQGFWWVGAVYWGEPDFASSAGRILWTIVVIVVAVLVVVGLARRSAHPEVPTVPATTDDRPETIPRPAEAAAFVTEPTAAASAAAPPTAPAVPAAGASDAELAAWKAQQEAWKQQRAAWVARQRAEDRARRLAAQAAWAEQRHALLAERRRREPWAGGAVIGIVFGLALIAGAGVGIATALAVPRGAGGWPAGFAAAAAVFGLGLAVAGLARRRAGALAAFAVLALVGALVTVPVAADRQLVPWVGGYGLDTTRSGSYARAGGETSFFVAPGRSAPGTVVDVWQRGGLMDVLVEDGAAVRIIATVHDGSMGRIGSNGDLELLTPDSVRGGVAHYDLVDGTGTPAVTLRLQLYSGSIQISPARSDATPEPTPTPSFTTSTAPSTAPTEGATP
ncbi:PspC domain-containing protein [Pseudolysinimonas sp.]|uniref:PspC domain-containing protein n=1 Tax=Pseudolysinimonas sp. TaxID=2680009 RepID=UPI003F7EAF44